MRDKHATRLPKKVREEFREYCDERDLTYSEGLMEILPEDGEPLSLGEPVMMDIDTPAHERLDALTGEGVDFGEVVAHFLEEAKEESE